MPSPSRNDAEAALARHGDQQAAVVGAEIEGGVVALLFGREIDRGRLCDALRDRRDNRSIGELRRLALRPIVGCAGAVAVPPAAMALAVAAT
jgi:hypothetical protein